MADQDPIAFTRGAADRIANAVRTVEIGSRRPGGIEWETQYPDKNPTRLKLGTFTGSWAVGTYKTVTLHETTQTVSVYNWCNAAIATGTTDQRYVIFGSVKGTHSAVELQMAPVGSTCNLQFGSLDLTQVAGYTSSTIQILGHNADGPCLQWYSITTCSTAA